MASRKTKITLSDELHKNFELVRERLESMPLTPPARINDSYIAQTCVHALYENIGLLTQADAERYVNDVHTRVSVETQADGRELYMDDASLATIDAVGERLYALGWDLPYLKRRTYNKPMVITIAVCFVAEHLKDLIDDWIKENAKNSR